MASESVAKTHTTVNEHQREWAGMCPRPEWEKPEHWEACRGLVPEMERARDGD